MDQELEWTRDSRRSSAATGRQDTEHRTRDDGPGPLSNLKSKHFRGDSRLELCFTSDSGRINTKLNSSGPHIAKIQSALEILDNANLEAEKGKYGPKTVVAIKKYKNDREILKASQKPGQADDTVGKGTIRRLDGDMLEFETNGRRGGGLEIPIDENRRSGSALAKRDSSFAIMKVDVAIKKLETFEATLRLRLATDNSLPAFDPVTVSALSTHFRLAPFDLPAIEPRRPVTMPDILHILSHFRRMRNVFVLKNVSFLDGSPADKNGNPVPAVSFLNSGSVIFGPHFRNFNDSQALMIGPHSRVAILIHEGFHAVDLAQKSGDDDNIHISEFSPKYDVQSANNSLFNPSSYASFAAHALPPGKDPNPRFGLDNKGRLL